MPAVHSRSCGCPRGCMNADRERDDAVQVEPGRVERTRLSETPVHQVNRHDSMEVSVSSSEPLNPIWRNAARRARTASMVGCSTSVPPT